MSGDGFPAELSVNWSADGAELRVLYDHLGPFPAAWATDPLGKALRTAFTAAPHPVSWCGATAWRGGPVHRKLYAGLHRWPHEERERAVTALMTHLGWAARWRQAAARIADVPGERVLECVAVDASDTPDPRVKIYYRHTRPDLGRLDDVAAVAAQHDRAHALTAWRILTGGDDGGHDPLTCLAWRDGQPAEATTYLRMPGLAAHDQDAVDRVARLLAMEGAQPARWRALAAALAPRPLSTGSGLVELVSHRTGRGPCDITTYLRFPVYRKSRR